ncbi:outer membrane protein assembly factor BamA [Salinihabitans flavidus]|nr:outer membrane protein assembly factor BamA [Salinihabitans flavidus]
MAFIALPQVSEAQSYRFSSVTIEGNQRIDPSAIVNYAGIARGQTVSASELNDAYQRVLASGLFESVEMVPQGNRLVIRVEEYPTINVVSFEGNRRLKDDALTEIVESRSRRVLNPDVVERDVARIVDAYVAEGRIAARVTPRIIRRSDNRTDLIFEIFEGGVVEVQSISFVGNQEYSDNRLRRVLNTKQAGILRAFIRSDTFIEDRIEFDKQVLRDFYLSRGYVDFRVTNVTSELSRARDGYYMTLHVEEGQQFRFGKITTVSEYKGADAKEFQESLRIREGVVYRPGLVENSITRLERLATRKGFDFLRAEPRITRNDRDLTLDVEFVLVRGERIFVERIDIEGNTTTLDRVVRQQFNTVEGDPFNPREIREAAERIRALGFFQTAEVNAREGSSPDQVIIDVDLEEEPTGSLSLGGTYSTNSGFGAVVQFSERNFLGRGQQLRLSFSAAEDVTDYGIQFAEPNLLGRDLRFGLDLLYRESESSFTRFDVLSGQFRPSLNFPVGENSRLGVHYSLSLDQLVIDPPNKIGGSLIDAEDARGDIWKSEVGYRYTYDSRTTGLNPNAGYLFEFGQDFGGLGGDYTYISTTGRAVAQTKVLNEEVTLRAALEGGMLYSPNDDSRVTDRFNFFGRRMRGFEPYGIGPREVSTGQNDPLGGTYFAVARFEAEFPLGLPEEYGITGGLFYDMGSVWGLDTTSTSVVQEDFALRHVVGFSLFWNTPVGPLRFNFSKALKKERYDNEQLFNLTIQTEF